MSCSKLIFDNATGRVICEDTGEVVAEDPIEDDYYPFYDKTESIERFDTKPKHKQIQVWAPINIVKKQLAKRLARTIKKMAKEHGLPDSVYYEAITLMKRYLEKVGDLDSVGKVKIMAKAFLKVAMLRRNMLPLNIEEKSEKRKGLFRAVNKIIELMNIKPTQEFTKEERVMAAIDLLAKEFELPMPIYTRAVDIARKNLRITVYNPNAYKWVAGVSVYLAACLDNLSEDSPKMRMLGKITLKTLMQKLNVSVGKFHRKVMWKIFFNLSDDERIRMLKCLGLMKRDGNIWVKFALTEDDVENLYKVAGKSKEEIAKFLLSNLDKVDISKVIAMKNRRKKKEKRGEKTEVSVELSYEDFIKLKGLELKRYEISKEDILLYMVNEALKKLKKEEVKQSAT